MIRLYIGITKEDNYVIYLLPEMLDLSEGRKMAG